MSKFIDMTGWVMKEHEVPKSKLTVVNYEAALKAFNKNINVLLLFNQFNQPNHPLPITFI